MPSTLNKIGGSSAAHLIDIYDRILDIRAVTNASGSPVLQPFPSWAANEQTSPSAFQYVQSMEIDSRGNMWVLDVGRVRPYLHTHMSTEPADSDQRLRS